MQDALSRTTKIALLGCVALMPLLILPVMVGSFVDSLGLDESQAGLVASAGFLGPAGAALLVSPGNYSTMLLMVGACLVVVLGLAKFVVHRLAVPV